MSLASKPVTDFGKESAENSTVSELITLLRSAFQPTDFHKVEKILATREENMKTEIANWKRDYELMEKKHGELALTKLEIEDELKKYKRECDVLREQITRFKEDQRVYCDREKRTEESNAKLVADFMKAETQNKKLSLKNMDLDSAKYKAERKLESCKKTFEELNLRVLRLEEEMTLLMNGDSTCKEKKENELGAEHPVSDEMVGAKETSSTGKSGNEVGVGTGSGNLTQPQVKESVSNFFEKDHSLAGAGSANDSLEVKNIRMRDAGPHSVIMACNNAKPVQNKLVSKRGSSNKVVDTSVAADVSTGSAVIIEINDSDDEMHTKDGKTRVPNVIASGDILSDKEIKSAHSGQTGDENRRSFLENCLLASSTKRKRGSCTNTCESKNDDDDMSPLSKLKAKTLQELIIEGSNSSSSGDSSSSDSDIESMIAMLRKRKVNNETWAFEVDMISAFKTDPELCMNAVCVLYRQQMLRVKPFSSSSLTKNRGFNQFDALRGTSLGKYLTNGDPQGKLKKSVSELQLYDPNGLDDCRKLAIQHSGQLFEIYQKKDDPFFHPS